MIIFNLNEIIIFFCQNEYTYSVFHILRFWSFYKSRNFPGKSTSIHRIAVRDDSIVEEKSDLVVDIHLSQQRCQSITFIMTDIM